MLEFNNFLRVACIENPWIFSDSWKNWYSQHAVRRKAA